MLSEIAQRDDLEEAVRLHRQRQQRRREQMAADTYSAPNMSLQRWHAKCTMSASGDDCENAVVDGGAYSENSIDERMRTLNILTSLLESDNRQRIAQRRERRRRIFALASLRESQKLQVVRLSATRAAIGNPVPIGDLDDSNTMEDALSDEPVATITVVAASSNDDDEFCDPHIVSLSEARAYVARVYGQSITIDRIYTKAMIVSREHKYTENTVIIGDRNIVFGHKNLFIGNGNFGNGEYCRARGADNVLVGKCCVNYDSGQRGKASGFHSVCIKIRLLRPTSAKEQLSRSTPDACLSWRQRRRWKLRRKMNESEK